MKVFILTLVALYIVEFSGNGVAGTRRNHCNEDGTGRAWKASIPMPGGFTPIDIDNMNDKERAVYEDYANKGIKLMNDVKTQGGSKNTMPLKLKKIVSAQSQVVAGVKYDFQLEIQIDGTAQVCFIYVTNLYPWQKNGGILLVASQCPNDPCAQFIPKETKRFKHETTHLLGGEETVNSNDAMVQEAAQWALEHINKMSNSLFRQSLLKISHVTKQVVNGFRYRFFLTTVYTSCRNNAENKHKTIEECPINQDSKPQDCDVSIIYSQGKYTMENFKCKAHPAAIGGDDHDYQPHGKIGGDDHDYKPHGIIGGDDHDYKPHGMIGGDDNDYKPHGKIGGDDHDYKPHGKIGGDDHDYKPHGMIGGDDHDYKPHGMIGDDHDYKSHSDNDNNLGQRIYDYIPHDKTLTSLRGLLSNVKTNNIKKAAISFGSGILHAAGDSVKHMSMLGDDTHDYVPHGDKFAEHVSEFKEFKTRYNRVYGTPDEEAQRFQIFCDNMEKVKKIRAVEQGSAEYGATQFADISEEEFRKHYLGFKPPATQGHVLPKAKIPEGPIPDSWDWRDHNAVTPVKNQGWCGSCWAFSTTGNIEGQWAINSENHQLLSLSEQELVDCDKIDQGCNGGFPIDAYKAIEELGGIETEQDYKYTGKDQKCEFNNSEVVVKLKGAVNISRDEGDMAAWLYKNGPISIGINSFSMQFYIGGIAHPWKLFCDPNALDHGVLIVGYGKKGKKPYWIIKNSWGSSWGRHGYYYIYRGDGSCGLNTMCTSAVVE